MTPEEFIAYVRQHDVTVVGDRAIRRLNARYLRRRSATDVLAFAMREGAGGALHPGLLGDVVISVATARRQARRGRCLVRPGRGDDRRLLDPGEGHLGTDRVLEIPTPRWTAYDQKRFGIKMADKVPMTIQERAYTSPIWYTP